MFRNFFVFGCNFKYAKAERLNKERGMCNPAVFSAPKVRKPITYEGLKLLFEINGSL